MQNNIKMHSSLANFPCFSWFLTLINSLFKFRESEFAKFEQVTIFLATCAISREKAVSLHTETFKKEDYGNNKKTTDYTDKSIY